jgi:hypothetical protein
MSINIKKTAADTLLVNNKSVRFEGATIYEIEPLHNIERAAVMNFVSSLAKGLKIESTVLTPQTEKRCYT